MKITHIFLLVLVFLIVIGGARAEYCYQETATEATDCGGLATGQYGNYIGVPGSVWTDPLNTFDGNWGTGSGTSDVGFLQINYTLPEGFTNGTLLHGNNSIWQGKDQKGYHNMSIPSACWNYSLITGKLMLDFGTYSNTWSCLKAYNTGMIILTQPPGGFGQGVLYEEAIWWDMTPEEPIVIPDTTDTSGPGPGGFVDGPIYVNNTEEQPTVNNTHNQTNQTIPYDAGGTTTPVVESPSPSGGGGFGGIVGSIGGFFGQIFFKHRCIVFISLLFLLLLLILLLLIFSRDKKKKRRR